MSLRFTPLIFNSVLNPCLRNVRFPYPRTRADVSHKFPMSSRLNSASLAFRIRFCECLNEPWLSHWTYCFPMSSDYFVPCLFTHGTGSQFSSLKSLPQTVTYVIHLLLPLPKPALVFIHSLNAIGSRAGNYKDPASPYYMP